MQETPKRPTPLEIAAWRFEQIAPLLDETLTSAQKRRVRREICHRESIHPNGEKKRIPRATLHRFVTLFQKHGFVGLIPQRRKDRGTQRRDTQEIVEHAIGLLFERTDRSIYLLSQFLARKFDGYNLSRATLARHLKAHPAYPLIETLRGKQRKLRGRYEAQAPHESWQLDGKGPFPVRLMSGQVVRVHILTVLDDFSRAILAGVVATGENTRAAIRVFKKAALRFGLPSRMQFDHGSAFDSKPFRHGLAQLGVHRNAVKAKNPQAQGKIEASNKSLGRWFIAELELETVRDLLHLEELLDAFLALIYQKHLHRSIGTTPEARLAGSISKRQVSESDLTRAFQVEIQQKSDRVTGEVQLENGRFVVPRGYAGKRCRLRFDLLRPFALLVTDDDREIELACFAIKPLPKPVLPDRSRPKGQLERLLDEYQGRQHENAEPAFGLPEVYRVLRSLVDRRVPNDETEAKLVLAFWNRVGPLASAPFQKACDAVKQTLGQHRALLTYLDHLLRRIKSDRSSPPPRKESP